MHVTGGNVDYKRMRRAPRGGRGGGGAVAPRRGGGAARSVRSGSAAGPRERAARPAFDPAVELIPRPAPLVQKYAEVIRICQIDSYSGGFAPFLIKLRPKVFVSYLPRYLQAEVQVS